LVVDRTYILSVTNRTRADNTRQEICFSKNGFYPYPLFGLLTTYQRAGLFAISGVTMWVAGGALRALYAWVNGYELTEALGKSQRARKMGTEGKWE
jgi:hypothetical protein